MEPLLFPSISVRSLAQFGYRTSSAGHPRFRRAWQGPGGPAMNSSVFGWIPCATTEPVSGTDHQQVPSTRTCLTLAHNSPSFIRSATFTRHSQTPDSFSPRVAHSGSLIARSSRRRMPSPNLDSRYFASLRCESQSGLFIMLQACRKGKKKRRQAEGGRRQKKAPETVGQGSDAAAGVVLCRVLL